MGLTWLIENLPGVITKDAGVLSQTEVTIVFQNGKKRQINKSKTLLNGTIAPS